MKPRTHISIAALFGALIVSAFCLGAVGASAQPIVWNPPCVTTKIINTTTCSADVKIMTNLGMIGPVSLPPGGGATITFAPGTTIMGAVSQFGTFVPIVSPGPTIPPPGPGTTSAGWVRGVVFAPPVPPFPAGCCFDLYFDQPAGASGCYIWLFPGTPVCTL